MQDSPSRLSEGLASKEEAELLYDLTNHPGWALYMQTVQADLGVLDAAIWVEGADVSYLRGRKEVLETVHSLRDFSAAALDDYVSEIAEGEFDESDA